MKRVSLCGRLKISGREEILEFQLRENRRWVVDFFGQPVFLGETFAGQRAPHRGDIGLRKAEGLQVGETPPGFAQAGLAFTQGGAPSYDIGAAGGGPIVDDKLGFRASIWDQRDGGYIDRVDPLSGQIVDRNANADEKLAGRLALALQATDTVRITPAVYYQQIDQDDSGRFFGNAYGSNASTGIFINGTFLPEVSRDKWVLPSIKVQASLPFADLTFDSSYTHRSLEIDLTLLLAPAVHPGTVRRVRAGSCVLHLSVFVAASAFRARRTPVASGCSAASETGARGLRLRAWRSDRVAPRESQSPLPDLRQKAKPSSTLMLDP